MAKKALKALKDKKDKKDKKKWLHSQVLFCFICFLFLTSFTLNPRSPPHTQLPNNYFFYEMCQEGLAIRVQKTTLLSCFYTAFLC